MLLSLQREQNFCAADKLRTRCQDKLEFCCELAAAAVLDRAVSTSSLNLNWLFKKNTPKKGPVHI